MGLFAEAERSGTFELLKPALAALEALGSAVEEHLHLLLPALVRLINPAQSSTPVEIRRVALRLVVMCVRGSGRLDGCSHIWGWAYGLGVGVGGLVPGFGLGSRDHGLGGLVRDY